jgi:hypothetical protein
MNFQKNVSPVASCPHPGYGVVMKNPWIVLCCICLAAASCTPGTPAARIAANPDQFAGLTAREQEIVRQGGIAKGMARDAVLLSWGAPARRFEGSQGGKSTERWDYTGSRPVYTSNFYGGYGYGRYGGYGRYSGMGLGFGPEIAYIPYRSATVWFISGKVDSWERIR